MPAETKNNIATCKANSRQAWRNWLMKNHDKKKSVWLIIYKKDSNIASVTYAEAVDEALCFGWIDSKANKRDELSSYQYFAKRNPKSNWSRVNKLKIAALEQSGMMMPAGIDMVNLAKKTGTWDALNDVEELKLPPALQAAFAKNKKAFKNWEAFPRSAKRAILEVLLNAKKEETKKEKIKTIVACAAVNKRAFLPESKTKPK